MGIIRKTYLFWLALSFSAALYAGDTPRVAMLMPFSLDQIKSNDFDKAHPISRAALEYYQGALLAMDSLEAEGINLEVNVFDVKRDTFTIRGLIASGQLADYDLYLGPFLNDRFELMSAYAAAQESPIVSPLAAFPNRYVNERYIHMNPRFDFYGKRLAEEIIVKYQESKVVVFSDGSAVAEASIKGLKNNLPSDLFAKVQLVKGLVPDNLYDTHADKDRSTVIFIPSTDEKFVNEVIKKLATSKGKSVTEYKKQIFIFGYQSWTDFRMPNYNLWDKFHVQLLGSHNYDRRDSVHTAFRVRFFEKFGTEPSEYAVKGYDQFLFLSRLLYTYGRTFPAELEAIVYPAHHTTFKFNKLEEEGYFNTTVHLLEFSNYRLQAVTD